LEKIEKEREERRKGEKRRKLETLIEEWMKPILHSV